ncbi:NUDIX family hydrolase [Nitzschia inconspicua]|uniref:NUDIX family hydrolase n=1 Tax=Nitzschia inconspicua TaxID=303405 RepID=A0A9K3L0L1_9STRA|nr:NUDIX family hydrolase [Nitzschia inconspicua]
MRSPWKVTMITLTTLHIASLRRKTSAFLVSRSISNQVMNRMHKQQLCLPHSKLFLSTTTKTTAPKIVAGEEKVIQDMLYRIRQCNNMPDEIRASLIIFELDGVRLGKVRPKMADLLCSVESPRGNGPVFELIQPSDSAGSPILTLSSKVAGTTVESRTEAVAHVTNELRQQGVITGWRDELFPVSDSFYNPPWFLIERAAVNSLGVLEYGVHINGLVKAEPSGNGGDSSTVMDPPPLMWMARRSATKSKFPGMLDHIVAGGQPAGLSLMENVVKECEEEAGIPEDIALRNVHPTGVISYEAYDPKREKVSRVVLFNYDLYLPHDFVPTPVDGEVEEFFLWSIDELKDSMAPDYPDPIKPNCYAVIIEFLLRAGFISPETPGYLDIVRELRSGDCR